MVLFYNTIIQDIQHIKYLTIHYQLGCNTDNQNIKQIYLRNVKFN